MRVYDLASMSCSYVLAGHTDIVLCLDTCVSSSGTAFIVTGSKDNSVSFCLNISLSLSLSRFPVFTFKLGVSGKVLILLNFFGLYI